jgi:hypothetical protein
MVGADGVRSVIREWVAGGEGDQRSQADLGIGSLTRIGVAFPTMRWRASRRWARLWTTSSAPRTSATTRFDCQSECCPPAANA